MKLPILASRSGDRPTEAGLAVGSGCALATSTTEAASAAAVRVASLRQPARACAVSNPGFVIFIFFSWVVDFSARRAGVIRSATARGPSVFNGCAARR